MFLYDIFNERTQYFENSVDSLQLMWSVPKAKKDQALEINSIKWYKAWNFTYSKQKLIYIGMGRKIIILGTKMSSGTLIHHTTLQVIIYTLYVRRDMYNVCAEKIWDRAQRNFDASRTMGSKHYSSSMHIQNICLNAVSNQQYFHLRNGSLLTQESSELLYFIIYFV